MVKICDFGSAKKYKADDASVAYITSRYYRAPELILGNYKYDFTIDVWSAGCVIAEIMLGRPVFEGNDARSVLLSIIKQLGTPTETQVTQMNPYRTYQKMTMIQGKSW